MLEIMEMFLGDMMAKKATLLELCEAEPKDFAKIGGIAHQFKGSSANLGAIKLVQAAVEMKEFCDNEQEKELRDSCAHFVKVLDEVDGHFMKYIRSVGSQGEPTGSPPAESDGGAPQAAAAGAVQPQPSESGGGAAAAAPEAAGAQGGEVQSPAPSARERTIFHLLSWACAALPPVWGGWRGRPVARGGRRRSGCTAP